MPELPEVETIRRALQEGGREGPAIPGWRIRSAELYWLRSLASPEPETFLEKIRGQAVRGVYRRAKFLDLALDRQHLVIHLRMSGDLRVQPAGTPPQKHDRLLLTFEEPFELIFSDPRKFGRVWFVDDPGELWQRLGPEPLDESLSPDEFYLRLKQRQRQLKPLLMDQSFLAGLGNIYTDEALFLAGLHPLQNSASLNRDQAARLLDAIRTQLQRGIARNGASIDWVYRGGDFQNSFSVYGKKGKNCPLCGTVIQKMVVGQRGTHFCPGCQQILGEGT